MLCPLTWWLVGWFLILPVCHSWVVSLFTRKYINSEWVWLVTAQFRSLLTCDSSKQSLQVYINLTLEANNTNPKSIQILVLCLPYSLHHTALFVSIGYSNQIIMELLWLIFYRCKAIDYVQEVSSLYPTSKLHKSLLHLEWEQILF